MIPLTERLLAQKAERRRMLAQLSYSEKVRIVEKLREPARKWRVVDANMACAESGLPTRRSGPLGGG